MSNYTVQSGDTLWKIAKSNYDLTTNQDIANKVNAIARANNISNPNSIFAGKALNLPEPSETATTTTNDKPDKNFDKWSISTAKQTQTIKEVALANVGKFAEEHYNENEAQLRDENVQSEAQKADDAISKLPEFRFIPKGIEINKNTYINGSDGTGKTDGLMKLSNDTIKSYSNLDGDDKTLTYKEYEEKELSDLAKMPDYNETDARSKEDRLKDTKQSLKLSFNTMDLNGDGKIDPKEEAVAFAYMDSSPDGEFNGRISQQGLSTFAAAGDPQKATAMKKKYNELYMQLFGTEK